MPELPLRLLLYGLAGLAALGCMGMLMLRAQGQQQRLRDRLVRLTAQHLRVRRENRPTLVRLAGGLETAHIWSRVMALFGVYLDRQDHYPIRWWMVLAFALLVARLAAGLGSVVLGGWAFLLMLPGWVWLSRAFFRWCERKHSETLFRQFPDALAMIVRSVRVGIPVGESIRMLARESPQPTAREFTSLGDQIAMGVPLEDALRLMSSHNNLPEYRFFATALSLQNQTGGALAETLENLADVIRKRVAAKSRGRALSAEANASATVLSAMPIVTGLALWVLNPGYVAILFDDPKGQRLLAFAAFLLCFGIGIMRMMIRKSLS